MCQRATLCAEQQTARFDWVFGLDVRPAELCQPRTDRDVIAWVLRGEIGEELVDRFFDQWPRFVRPVVTVSPSAVRGDGRR